MEEKNKTIKLTPKVGEKTKEQPKEQPKKLSYEELENAARQIAMQAESIAKENAQLKKIIESNDTRNFYADLEYRFKVLKYSNFFSDELIKNVVKDITTVMLPKEEDNGTEESK